MLPPPDEPPAEETELGDNTAFPGLRVARINPRTMLRFGLPLSLDGVVVTEPGPYAGPAGLRAGDVIVAINGALIERPRDVRRALTRPGRYLRIDLLRQGQRVSLRLRL